MKHVIQPKVKAYSVYIATGQITNSDVKTVTNHYF